MRFRLKQIAQREAIGLMQEALFTSLKGAFCLEALDPIAILAIRHDRRVKDNFIADRGVDLPQYFHIVFGIVAFAKPSNDGGLQLGQLLNHAPRREAIPIDHRCALVGASLGASQSSALAGGCIPDIINLPPVLGMGAWVQASQSDRSPGFQAKRSDRF